MKLRRRITLTLASSVLVLCGCLALTAEPAQNTEPSPETIEQATASMQERLALSAESSESEGAGGPLHYDLGHGLPPLLVWRVSSIGSELLLDLEVESHPGVVEIEVLDRRPGTREHRVGVVRWREEPGSSVRRTLSVELSSFRISPGDPLWIVPAVTGDRQGIGFRAGAGEDAIGPAPECAELPTVPAPALHRGLQKLAEDPEEAGVPEPIRDYVAAVATWSESVLGDEVARGLAEIRCRFPRRPAAERTCEGQRDHSAEELKAFVTGEVLGPTGPAEWRRYRPVVEAIPAPAIKWAHDELRDLVKGCEGDR